MECPIKALGLDYIASRMRGTIRSAAPLNHWGARYKLKCFTALHKVLHAPGEGGVWENVAVCKRGGVWRSRVTSHILFWFFITHIKS